MKAILISIGDELLIGNTLNTNAHWISQQLTQLGVEVSAHWTIADTKTGIQQYLTLSENRADIVLITGGLGPTNDDLTVESLKEYFRQEMTFHPEVWENIRQMYISRNRPIHEPSIKMAYLPANAQVIHNTQGTAPGSIYHEGRRMIVSMPGVPYEMKAMMKDVVLPLIRQRYTLPVIAHSHLYTAGVGETVLSDALVGIESSLPDHFSLAYLPSVGKVRLRLSGHGYDEPSIMEQSTYWTQKILEAIRPYVYSTEEPSFETVIGQMLRERNLQFGTAESCTGGYISHLITKVPGSSDYYKGSVISYSNEVKMQALHVRPSTLEEHGAVSEETVSEMLTGVISHLGLDIAVAVSGVAGPGGGSESKPVGCVYIGVADQDRQYIRRLQFGNNRERNIELTATTALVMLSKFLKDHYPL